MTVPAISAFVAAILIILQQLLMILTGMHRAKAGIGVGVGDDQHLERKVRRHGNLAENAAIFIATLALAELIGAPRVAVTGLGVVFVCSRLLHAVGFSTLSGSHQADGSKIFVLMRALGAFGTFLCGITLGGFLAFTLSGMGS